MIGPSYEYAALVQRIIDGDTYEVIVDLGFNIFHNIHVRLKDFDTPELRSKDIAEREHAQAAKAFVSKIIPPGTMVMLATAKSAIYNRWEAEVWYVDTTTALQTSLAESLRHAGFEKRSSYGA